MSTADGQFHIEAEREAERPSGGGSALFWPLVGMAVMVLAPCILLPVWRNYQALCYAEQVERAGLEQARGELQHQRQRLAALQHDPAVIGRVARREFGYRRPGEVEIGVGVPAATVEESASFKPAPVRPPAAVARLVDRLPAINYDALFCVGPTRMLLLCLSVGLIVAAWVVGTPRRQPVPTGPGDDDFPS